VTGAGGFIGTRVVQTLLRYGFTNITALVRSAGSARQLTDAIRPSPGARVKILEGNLLSREFCCTAVKDIRVIYHLAAGVEKSFAGCVLNSVVTTRNLIEAVDQRQDFRRFVNVSSFSVYSNARLRRRALLDETCDLETEHVSRNEPYAYAKLTQEELLREQSARTQMPYVILRPGVVYGSGGSELTPRVGLGTFGIFLHLGHRNIIPFTYVDNCAEAIVLAGLVPGIEGQAFNIVDDDLPSSAEFLRAYKKQVGPLKYIPVPYWVFYLFSYLWERYSHWSGGQLPSVFNRRRCETYWKGNRYSNAKLKTLLGWAPTVSFSEGSAMYFQHLRANR
jgi:nucleoside-diphosphate-sugar epimerase